MMSYTKTSCHLQLWTPLFNWLLGCYSLRQPSWKNRISIGFFLFFILFWIQCAFPPSRLLSKVWQLKTLCGSCRWLNHDFKQTFFLRWICKYYDQCIKHSKTSYTQEKKKKNTLSCCTKFSLLTQKKVL